MSRLPYAAETLLMQIAAHRTDAEVTNGEPDGLGVVRSFTFDKATSRWLWPLIQAEMDERLSSGVMDHGVLTLTFQGGSRLADDRREFTGVPAPAPTEQPVEVSADPDSSMKQSDADVPPETSAPVKAPARKAPARRASAKPQTRYRK